MAAKDRSLTGIPDDYGPTGWSLYPASLQEYTRHSVPIYTLLYVQGYLLEAEIVKLMAIRVALVWRALPERNGNDTGLWDEPMNLNRVLVHSIP